MTSITRPPYEGLDASSLLHAPVDTLVGVPPEAPALRSLGIATVFDLATSRVFEAAETIVAAAHGTDDGAARVYRQFGRVPKDLLDRNVERAPVAELADLPIGALQDIGPKQAEVLTQQLGLASISQLGSWAPYRAARDLLLSAARADEDALPALVPRVTTYPTERVQYVSFLLDRLLPTDDPEELTPVADAEPLDLADPSLSAAALRPAVGAMLTFTQSWYPKALALGHLLHTVALAPGETTRIAMVDWSRASMTAAAEDISEHEALSATVTRTRSISEVTHAVADELQTGRSTAATAGLGSLAGASGGATLPAGPASLGLGSTSGIGMGIGGGASWSSSSGHRAVSAQMTQAISDRTQQAANAARNRRATLVREISETESEKLTTRAITNYNHMHALTIEYFEVVQLYRVVTELTKAQRCLFLPIKPIDFREPTVIQHFRTVIAAVGLTKEVRGIISEPPDHMNVSMPLRKVPWLEIILRMLRDETHEPVGEVNSDRLMLPDAEIEQIIWATPTRGKASTPGHARIRCRDGTELTLPFEQLYNPPPSDNYFYKCAIGKKVSTITLVGPSGAELSHCNALVEGVGAVISDLHSPAESTEHVLVMCEPTYRSEDLIAHLETHRDYYTSAIWATASRSAIEALLSRRGLSDTSNSLLEQLDPTPLAVSGNYMLFRFHAPQDDPEWASFLSDHGVECGHQDETLVPLPSSGVFAEAILGRANSAEELDMTRFWNWQDSPIPLAAPEIAALQAGSRADAEPGQPGQLGQPIINLVNAPELPGASGLADALSALGSANMFRDMSGLAGTQAMSSAALAQAVGAAVKGSEQSARALEAITGRTVSAAGAKVNEGAKLDEKQRAAGTAASANDGATEDRPTSHEAAAFRSSLPSDGAYAQVTSTRPDGSQVSATGPTDFVGQIVPALAEMPGSALQASPPGVTYQPPWDVSNKFGIETTSTWRWRSQKEIGWTKCFETCNAMLAPYGVRAGSAEDSITIFAKGQEYLGEDPDDDRLYFGYVDISKYNNKTVGRASVALTYLVNELEAGRPVVVGVTWNTADSTTLNAPGNENVTEVVNGKRKIGGYNDGVVDHFVVIVDYDGTPARPTRFHLSDPATSRERESHGWFEVEDVGDLVTPKPLLVKHGDPARGPDGRNAFYSIQARYEVTQVRRNRTLEQADI